MSREKQIFGVKSITELTCFQGAEQCWSEVSCEYCIESHLLAAGWRKQAWISVEDRLPPNDWGKHWKERKYYLVFTKPSGLMNVATYGYKEHGWWIDRNSCVLDKKNYKEVTHWMPLPEPPKGE